MPTLAQRVRRCSAVPLNWGRDRVREGITTGDFVGLSKKLQLRAAKVSKPKFPENSGNSLDFSKIFFQSRM
jgi:hypothetical protein